MSWSVLRMRLVQSALARQRGLADRVSRRLPARPANRLARAAAETPSAGALTPVLVDYFTRDGSTLMMRLLASSPQIALGARYPYEQKYFAYMWRWSRLLDRKDWPEGEWTPDHMGSLMQEPRAPLMGPPPWRERILASPPGEPQLARSAFDLAWEEFSRRAVIQTRLRHRNPGADVRYYAEKHLNTHMVDLAELPPVRLIVLLRDPRDTYLSVASFREARGVAMGDPARGERADLEAFIGRQRDRLRWIAALLEAGEVPVVRYADLVRDLPGVARSVEEALGVDLDPRGVERQVLRWGHATSRTPEASVGRWRREMAADVAALFAEGLGPELRSLGFDDGED